MKVHDQYLWFLELIITLLLIGGALNISFSRLDEPTLFNVSLFAVVLGGSIAAIFGLRRKYKESVLNKSKLSGVRQKPSFFLRNGSMILNTLCGACLLLILISTKTDLIVLSKEAHALLFFLSAITFAISTAIKFFETRKLKKNVKAN